MNLKLFFVAIAMTCTATYGITIDLETYFAFAKGKYGSPYSFALSKKPCSSSSEKGKWMKAAIYFDTGYGIRVIDGCWIKDKQPNDGFGRQIDLKICGVEGGVIQTPCKQDAFSSFVKTTDLPRSPSRAEF